MCYALTSWFFFNKRIGGIFSQGKKIPNSLAGEKKETQYQCRKSSWRPESGICIDRARNAQFYQCTVYCKREGEW